MSQLIKAITHVSELEAKSFWRWVANEVRDLSGKDSLRRLLSEAEIGIRGGRHQPRSSLGGARMLSSNQLQNVVLNHKEQILPYVTGCGSWNTIIAKWVAKTRREALERVLDALECPHSAGIRQGEPKIISPDDAFTILESLAEEISVEDLVIVLAGLMDNSKTWGFLEVSLSRLLGKVNQGGEIDLLSQLSSTIPMIEPTLNEVSERVFRLRQEMTNLAGVLEITATILRLGQMPDADSLKKALDWVVQELTALSSELGIREHTIDGIQAVLQERERIGSISAEINVLERLCHLEKLDTFEPLHQVRKYCSQARDALSSLGTSDQVAEVMEPLRALRKLVEEGKTLDDVQISDMHEAVQKNFGTPIFTAAIRGNLFFRNNIPEPVEKTSFSDTVGDAVELVEETSGSKEPLVDINETGPFLSEVLELTKSDEPSTSDDHPALGGGLAGEDKLSISSGLPELEADKTASPSSSLPVDKVTIALMPKNLGSIPPSFGPVEIDKYLLSLDAFREHFWLSPKGQVEAAPWTDPSTFSQEINKALDRAIEIQDFGQVYLFTKVLGNLGYSGSWNLDDLQSAEAISESPESISAGLSDSRANRLLNLLQMEQSGLDMRLPSFLELLRPDPDSGICLRFEKQLEHLFHDGDLKAIVRYLAWGQTVSIDALRAIKAQITHGGGKTPAEFEQELDKNSKELRSRVNELRNAAGGKLQQTHCRNAWKHYMDSVVQPLYDNVLGTSRSKRNLTQELSKLRLAVRRMKKSYTQIMDDRSVKLNDRSMADRRAAELEKGFTEILDGLEKLNSLGDTPSQIQIPIESVRRLQEDHDGRDAVEELCRQIFLRVLSNPTKKYPLRLNAHVFLDIPALLGELKLDALKDPSEIEHGLPIGFFRPPLFGSATLLARTATSNFPASASLEGVLLETREHALEFYRERPDLLSYLSAVPRLLDSSDRNRLHHLALEYGDKAFQNAKELVVLAKQCQDLLSTNHVTLRAVVESASNLADRGISSDGLTEGLLMLEWIIQLKKVCYQDRDTSIASYKRAVQDRNPEFQTKLESLIKSGDFRRIPLFQDGGEPAADSNRPASRRTNWRSPELLHNFSSRWVRDLKKIQGESSFETQELIQLWLEPSGNPKTKQKFRRLFYRWISGEEGLNVARRKRVFPEGLAWGFDSMAIHIHCGTIRKMFRKERLNPTFLPQLADYSDIVLLSHSSMSLRKDGIATDWVKSVGAESNNSLVVFLAPKLSESKRAEILAAFRARNLSAALIDDFDFWRLAMVDDSLGHDFVPFLEIVMEQLRLEKVSPFSNQDGQHVRLETYVGRQEAAEKLAKTAHYSRVFSGRKLGKSALLKQVEIVYDHSELPSGNRLNVLFITIAGGDSEAWIVEQIVGDMSKRFDLSAGLPPQASPSDRFRQFIESFINQRPHDSLLIILDEADQFVEGQLENYDRDRENSLSFRMMKELPAWTDKLGLPRVRVILSGYRVTHTREGVWANAGDVMRLVPLQQSEAIQFIQGALARIGVDIAEHAEFIARRCGLQPAILIQFGRSLLRRLEIGEHRRSLRQKMDEYIAVTSDDVEQTFTDSSIIEEIRTVVSNNFQGNRVGGVIFDALLLAMQELSPGFGLLDAPRRILEKIREIEPDLSWLTRIDPTPESEIKRNLRDFMERELLIEDKDGYRLRFPHYLPILTLQTDLSLTIRQRIHALMQTPPVRRRGGSILAEQSMDRIRYWYDQERVEICRLVAVGGGWITALEHQKVGVADRLGCNQSCLHRGSTKLASAIELARVFFQLDEDDCGVLASGVSKPAVVLGGVDILRWALRQEAEGSNLLVETVPIQRITESNIAWWFEGARALHFESANAITLISEATGGIPFFLEKFDEILAVHDGGDVTSETLAQTRKDFDARLPLFAEELRSGPPNVRLTPREIELVGMLAEIAVQGLDTALGADFSLNWALCDHDNSIIPPYENPEDDLALRTLVGAGILSLDDQKKVQLKTDGVELRIANNWKRHAVP